MNMSLTPRESTSLPMAHGHIAFVRASMVRMCTSAPLQIQTKISSLYSGAKHNRPFREDNGLFNVLSLRVNLLEGQCIATEDVATENEANSFATFVIGFLLQESSDPDLQASSSVCLARGFDESCGF